MKIREQVFGREHIEVAIGYNNLASIHEPMGQYAKALPLHERALAMFEKLLGENHPSVATSLNNQAQVLRALGQYPKAIALTWRALSIREKVFGAHHPDVAATLNNLAMLHRALNEFKKALAYAQRGLAINEKTRGSSHPEVATNLNNIARIYDLMRDPAKALPLHPRALAIREDKQGREHPDIARSLNAVADTNTALGRHEKIVPLRVRAQRIARLRNGPDALWRAQHGLLAAHAREGRRELGIFYAKQAVNTIQGLRTRIVGMERGTRGAFLQDKMQVYCALADLLIEQGRLSEARQVLNLLKEEEFFDFIRLISANDSRIRAIKFTAFEQPWHVRMQQQMDALARIGAELAALERKARLGVTDAEKARLSTLASERAAAGARLGAFHRELETAFGTARKPDTASADAILRELRKTLAALGAGTVAIHYVTAENRLNLLLTTAATQIARSVAVERRNLEQKIEFFRVALRNPSISAEPMARELHKLLIAPLAADLTQAKARTLMLALDGSLRYISFAALHEGSGYLIERYDLALYTEVARENLQRRPVANATIAGLGVARKIEDFEALPAVKAELESIVKHGAAGLMRGDLRLDQQFSVASLKDALAKKHPLVHIASHFVFRPGNESTSFLLLGDGDKLSLSRIREDKLDFRHVDLVTLSACETALGGGRNAQGAEVEGLGTLVQKQGAKGVIATLWPVADASTGLLMQNFYSLRMGGKLNKASALKQTQLALLRGQVTIDGGAGNATQRGLTTAPGAVAKPGGTFVHPYYWAPFILMGNWL